MRRLMILSNIVVISFALSVLPARAAGPFTYTTVVVPGALGIVGAALSQHLGIDNAGDIVGTYMNSDYSQHGFLLSKGAPPVTTIDDPGGETLAQGINNFGQIVGWYSALDTSVNRYTAHAFLFAAGSFSPIVYDGAVDMVAYGINDLGQIVGFYKNRGTNQYMRGFLLAAGSFSPIDYGIGTRALGINNLGQIVGSYEDQSHNWHGFLRAAGHFTQIDYPGAAATTAAAINDVGQIVGYYRGTDNKVHGFLRDAQARYALIEYPGATDTYPSAINNPNRKGHYSIVGTYGGADGREHLFVGAPCLPHCL